MHDKSMTAPNGLGRRKGPVARIKHGSAIVPIYAGKVHGKDRFTVTFYLNGQRMRRTFGSLPAAREEAARAAQKIQEGFAYTNDIRPHEREAFLVARRIADEVNVPLLSAIQEYAECRRRLGNVTVLAAVDEFLRHTRDVKLGVKLPDVAREFLEAKAQDNVSRVYHKQLSQTLAHFAHAFPGEILPIRSTDIDQWLRKRKASPATRNSNLRCLKVFFSFAKTRSYLPKGEPHAAEQLAMVKTGETKTEIFTPQDFARLLNAAPQHLLGLLVIGGFAGLRAAEIERLDWSAVDLERRIIVLRAGQTKTASRRIVPLADNLAAWLAPLSREGKVVHSREDFREVNELARHIGIQWPHNGLRHSYVSYRLAMIEDVSKVALEAGNSPAIIFKHYRELVTRDAAQQWFSIAPPEGWASIPSDRRRNVRRRRIGNKLHHSTLR